MYEFYMKVLDFTKDLVREHRLEYGDIEIRIYSNFRQIPFKYHMAIQVNNDTVTSQRLATMYKTDISNYIQTTNDTNSPYTVSIQDATQPLIFGEYGTPGHRIWYSEQFLVTLVSAGLYYITDERSFHTIL